MVWGLFLAPLTIWLVNAPQPLIPVSTEILIYTVFALAAINIMCVCWLCPYYASGDTSLEFKRPPNRTARELNRATWMGPIMFGSLGVLLMLVPVFDNVFFMTGWVGDSEQLVGKACLAACFIMVIPSLLVSRKLCPRVVDMTRRRLICFECGYDLRNIEHATTCPECGEAVPWINQANSLAIDPAQGPAGHDQA